MRAQRRLSSPLGKPSLDQESSLAVLRPSTLGLPFWHAIVRRCGRFSTTSLRSPQREQRQAILCDVSRNDLSAHRWRREKQSNEESLE